MDLSQTAEYALRAAACLGALKEGEALAAQEIGERTAVPPSYLSKLLRKMVVAKVLVARKGHGGGFQLARPARSVTFYDVLASVDCLLERDRCAFGLAACNAREPCPLHDAWSELSTSIVDWSKRHTLAEMATRRSSRIHVAPRRRLPMATPTDVGDPKRRRRSKRQAR